MGTAGGLMAGNHNIEDAASIQGDKSADRVKDCAQPQSWNMLDLVHGSEKNAGINQIHQINSAEAHLPLLTLAGNEPKTANTFDADIHNSVMKKAEGKIEFVDPIAKNDGPTDKNDPNYQNGKSPMELHEPEPGLREGGMSGIMMPRDPNNPERPLPGLKKDPDVWY